MIPPQIEEGCASCNPSGVGVEMGRGTRGALRDPVLATRSNASGVVGDTPKRRSAVARGAPQPMRNSSRLPTRIDGHAMI